MTNSFIEFPRINQKQGSINLYKILNQIELSIYIYAYKFKSWLHKKKKIIMFWHMMSYIHNLDHILKYRDGGRLGLGGPLSPNFFF